MKTSRPLPGIRSRGRAMLELVALFVDRYMDLWLEKSQTMRLTAVEGLFHKQIWQDVKQFVGAYGHELFHASMLSPGEIRAVLHLGVEHFLLQLSGHRDPLRKFDLLDDLDDGNVDLHHVVRVLELIYSVLIDRFDRYAEYNATTTQSDYGEELSSLLDFLRLESAYERDGWNLEPIRIAHETLAECGQLDAARWWEIALKQRSAADADTHVARLGAMEKKYGMLLPSIHDHVMQRFVKPLAVDRMQALVPLAVENGRNGRITSAAFDALEREIDAYLQNATGSGFDVPEWLRTLEDRVIRALGRSEALPDEIREPSGKVLGWRQLIRQLRE